MTTEAHDERARTSPDANGIIDNPTDEKQRQLNAATKQEITKKDTVKHSVEKTTDDEDIREELLQGGFKFSDLKVLAHARERWSLRGKGGTLGDFLVSLDYAELDFTCKRQPDDGRWLVTANEVTFVLDRHKTKIITVLRQRGYDYVREAYEQRLHSMTTDELPWGELMPKSFSKKEQSPTENAALLASNECDRVVLYK
eukprot:INCI2322.1.p1 GENE.INCI2322.1~~INCI2322.1.p1  ORF type:complete len:199 (+),score=36.87 INCI2322.1:260-856(+)